MTRLCPLCIRSTPKLDKYLGFPMIHGRMTKGGFEFIVEKMQTRLASWKNKMLNKAGRVTLAKSVLNSIPIYYMQVAWFLKHFAIRLID